MFAVDTGMYRNMLHACNTLWDTSLHMYEQHFFKKWAINVVNLSFFSRIKKMPYMHDRGFSRFYLAFLQILQTSYSLQIYLF